MTFDRNPIFINNEFSEVPFDGVNQSATLFVLQEGPQRMRTITIHIDLLKEIKVDFVVF